MRLALPAVLLVVLAFSSGCSNSDLPPMADVRGTVLLEGDPVPDAIVTLTPTAGGRPAQGVTDSTGAFEMSTFSMGDGALVGEHQVVINPVKAPPPSYVLNPRAARGYEPPFPSRYWSASSSELTTVVEAGKTNELSLDLVSD